MWTSVTTEQDCEQALAVLHTNDAYRSHTIDNMIAMRDDGTLLLYSDGQMSIVAHFREQQDGCLKWVCGFPSGDFAPEEAATKLAERAVEMFSASKSTELYARYLTDYGDDRLNEFFAKVRDIMPFDEVAFHTGVGTDGLYSEARWA